MSIVMSKFFDVSLEEIVSLSTVEYLTPHVLLKIAQGFGSLSELIKASESQLLARGFSTDIARQIANRQKNVGKQMTLMKKNNIWLVQLDSPEYPKLLKEINDPPLWLYVIGALPKDKDRTITVVGTRKPTTYALAAMSQVLSKELLEKIVVVSGLAYGVDKNAHELSLSAGGRTVAVLAGGLDNIYPAAHVSLARKIIENEGGIISEYSPLSRPAPYRFPIRNRIIAGLSPLTFIVEAAIKSGTLTTAKAALDYNRDVAAMPGDINRKLSEGANLLIKRGAFLISDESDLENYYGIKSNKKAELVDKELLKILNLLSAEPKTIDDLIATTGRDIADILPQLTELELLGLVYQASIGCYAAKRK